MQNSRNIPMIYKPVSNNEVTQIIMFGLNGESKSIGVF